MVNILILFMPVRINHDLNPQSIYFVTFTCYKWKNLFSISRAYDTIYKWFDWLYNRNIYVTGYVIMPNHIHVLLYFPQMTTSLNSLIGNAKRFMAYEIVKRLENRKETELLEFLQGGVRAWEQKKGQRHKVFEESFDAKECISDKFIFQKLHYIHHNPVSKKWNLVNDFTDYEYSSASYYENGIRKYGKLKDINDVLK